MGSSEDVNEASTGPPKNVDDFFDKAFDELFFSEDVIGLDSDFNEYDQNTVDTVNEDQKLQLIDDSLINFDNTIFDVDDSDFNEDDEQNTVDGEESNENEEQKSQLNDDSLINEIETNWENINASESFDSEANTNDIDLYSTYIDRIRR